MNAQSLLGARVEGVAASNASVRDVRGFVANPAGLVTVRDWDITTTTYMQTSAGESGFVFHGFGLGKRFLERNAAAVQYAPGSVQEFVLPSPVTITDAKRQAVLGTRIRYDEQFSFGYGHQMSDDVSVGLGGRLRTTKITETLLQYVSPDTSSATAVVDNQYNSSSWLFDLGIMWSPAERLVLSALGRSLVRVNGGNLTADFEKYRLPSTTSLEVGVRYLAAPWMSLAVDASTATIGAAGVELTPGAGLSVRAGLYVDAAASPLVHALGFGLGYTRGFIEVDASYLFNLNKDLRKGTTALSAFDPGRIRSIDMNPYGSDRLSLSVKVAVGNIRTKLVKIQTMEMLGSIYPSAYQVFAYRAIGNVRVRNISSKLVDAKASFFVDRFMDAPTESPAVTLMPGEEKEIPLTAVFNETVKTVPKAMILEGMATVTAGDDEEYDDRLQAKVLMRGKNDWDGDVRSLRYFVTPDDPSVIRYTRDVLLRNRDSLASVHKKLESLQKARVLFNTFSGKLLYVKDPKQSGDYVQYPSETLQLRGGDCDDMTACFTSLLASVGMSTAFVDVVPPGEPEKSHIYMLFDTGVEPTFASTVSDNPKRYVVRRNSAGVETLWIPIESTVITKGFEESWSVGAQEYYDDVEVHLGLVKGWVRIVDVY